jgi:low temperature requirement protein LtrA
MTVQHRWRPFGPRDPHEPHRVATPLELLFDLVSVIAIASAAQGLHHAIAEGHTGIGVMTYAFAFFATWWAWVNFTWFASAYDNDGPVYRLLTAWIMAGALVVAAGVPRMFAGLDLTLAVLGYGVMRVGMVAFWLIAAWSDPRHKRTARAYALGIVLVQLYWTLALMVFRPTALEAIAVLFVLGMVLEMAVPVLAERRGITPWHHHHVSERHGLFVIIVLGEVLLSSVSAFTYASGQDGDAVQLVVLAVSALVITIAMWWLYFSQEGPLDHDTFSSAFRWSYAHALLYASGAAVGAGFAVVVDVFAGKGHPPLFQSDLAVAVPLAIYLAALWFVRDRSVLTGAGRHVLLPFALAVLAAGWAGAFALPVMAMLAAASVFARSRVACRPT